MKKRPPSINDDPKWRAAHVAAMEREAEERKARLAAKRAQAKKGKA
jgi:hypothetical protein